MTRRASNLASKPKPLPRSSSSSSARPWQALQKTTCTSSGTASTPRANGYKGPALLDRVVDLEQRHVHRDHDEADHGADDDDHQRLEDRREGLDRGRHLVLV